MEMFINTASGGTRALRIAYVDVNVRYMNRTRDALIAALVKCGKTTLIGPGFSNGNSVDQLRSMLSVPGEVDVIVTTPHVALAASFEGTDYRSVASLYRKSFCYHFPDSEFDQIWQLNALLTKTVVPRTLMLLEADYYNFDANRIAAFESVADVIFGFGPESWSHTAAMPRLMEESFGNRATNCWADFLASNDHRIFALHHLVGEDECCTTPLAERKHSWSVMGANYAARGVAIGTLRTHDVKPLVTSAKRKIVGGLKRLGLLRGESDFTLNLVQGDFHRKLCNSRYSYTCGSGLDMPIRKFFEIPAAGSVLVCRPFHGAQHLGFIAGEHYVESEPQDLWDVHCHLEANPDEAQRIAHAGQSLVKRLHSVGARSEQLRQSLEAVISSSGVGRWCDGRFEIKPVTRNSELQNAIGLE